MSAPTVSADPTAAPHQQPLLVKYRTGLTWIPALAFLWVVVTSRSSLAVDTFHFVIKLIGYALIGVGAVGRMWCGVYIAGRKNKELCQDGPYSLCRNPLYVFSFIGTVGVALGARLSSGGRFGDPGWASTRDRVSDAPASSSVGPRLQAGETNARRPASRGRVRGWDPKDMGGRVRSLSTRGAAFASSRRVSRTSLTRAVPPPRPPAQHNRASFPGA